MVKLLGSLALAAGLAVSAGANAGTTYELGTLGNGLSEFTESVGVGSFSDTLDFTIGKTSTVGTGVASADVVIFGSSALNISGLNMSVFNSGGTALGSGTDINLGTLSAGNYYAVVTGKGTGYGGGVYTDAFSISAVPEASTWVMMLAGLGMLGFVASRRKA